MKGRALAAFNNNNNPHVINATFSSLAKKIIKEKSCVCWRAVKLEAELNVFELTGRPVH